MEVRKSSSVIPTGARESAPAETEKSTKIKSLGVASLKDSFEVVANTRQENFGKKELGAAQQQEASRMNYKDFEKNGSSQDTGSRLEDAKNSGLVARLGHQKEESTAKADRLPNGMNAADVQNLTSPIGSERTNDAVKDAQQKLAGGTNLRESLDQEVAQRRQGYTALGGSSPMDRLLNQSRNPGADPTGKSGVPTGQDMLEYSKGSDPKVNADGSVTTVREEAKTENGVVSLTQRETTLKKDLTKIVEEKQTKYFPDNSKVETDKFDFYDANENVTRTTSKTTTTSADGSTKVSITETTKNQDGSTTTSTNEKNTPAGGSKKMPGIDDRDGGNIPEDIKQSEQYFLQQALKAKPKSGGETELTDGGATGNSVVASGPVDNAFTRMGGVMGALGQPTRSGGEDIGDPSNFSGGSSPINNGGATDPSEGSNYTGRTIQDDPADVQFGPAGQPKQQTNKKETKSQDSSSSLFDLLRRNQKIR